MPRISLPSPDEPMQMPDGTALAPSSVQTFARHQVPSNSAARRLVSNTQRKLAELPALPKQLNSYAAVLVYTASGLSDAEISVATGISKAQLGRMREHPAYTELEKHVVTAVKEQAATEVAAVLAEGEIAAAQKVVTLLSSEDDKVKLAAAKDILDRRGHAAKQVIDLRAEMMQTFRIEYVDKRGDVPVIDMELDNGDST